MPYACYHFFLLHLVHCTFSSKDSKIFHFLLLLIYCCCNFHVDICFQARVDEDLLIYEAFPQNSGATDVQMTIDHLRIRFRKISHSLILREKHVQTKKKGEEEEEPPDENTPPDYVQQLRYFEDVSGYSGVNYIFFVLFRISHLKKLNEIIKLEPSVINIFC